MNSKGEKTLNQVFLEDSPRNIENGLAPVALKLKPNLKGLSSAAAAPHAILPLAIPLKRERMF